MFPVRYSLTEACFWQLPWLSPLYSRTCNHFQSISVISNHCQSPSFLQSHSITPKGPFCTKNTMAPESVVFCYRRSSSLSVPFSCLFCQKNRHLGALSVAFCHLRTDFSPRTEFTLRSLVRTGGSLGLSVILTQSKRRNLLATRRWGKQRLILGVLSPRSFMRAGVLYS